MVSLLLSLLLIFSSFYSGECQPTPRAPALYVFGDSLSDNGNLNEHGFNFIFYRPYGMDFINQTATGRVTNGKIVPDFIAEYLRLPPPTYPPPYNVRRERPLSRIGYNYASMGCGILPETGSEMGCLTLSRQISMFNETRTNLTSIYNETQLEEHLSNSIFFIWTGGNDYITHYFQNSDNTSVEYDPEQYAQLLIDRLSEKIKILHSLGARKMVVFDLPPLGCLPEDRSSGGDCDQGKNAIGIIFNNKLSSLIQELDSTLQEAHFTFGKVYDLTYNVIRNPEQYGMKNVMNACCPRLIGGMMCMPEIFIPNYCDDRHQYLFWDGVHPTQAAHSTLAEKCINDPSMCTPMTIDQLVAIQPKPFSLRSAA